MAPYEALYGHKSCNTLLFTKSVSENFSFLRDITTSLELSIGNDIYIFSS